MVVTTRGAGDSVREVHADTEHDVEDEVSYAEMTKEKQHSRKKIAAPRRGLSTLSMTHCVREYKGYWK